MRLFGWIKLSILLTGLMPICHSQAFVKHPSLDKTPADFTAYVSSYKNPQFFDDNEKALQARIKLLDQLPPGGTAKVMTFVYENGESTRLLATHMCLAAKRGVNVQFVPDSKTGDRPSKEDAFDASPKHKINEEVYQMLANCGVDVRVHNHIQVFDTVALLNKRIPAVPKGVLSTLVSGVHNDAGLASAAVAMVDDLGETFEKVILEEANSKEELETLKRLKGGLSKLLLTSVKSLLKQDSEEERTALILNTVEKIRAEIKASGFMAKLRPERLEVILYKLVESIQKHPRLGEFYKQARLFNRLNHRKLFWVESGGQSCMLLGGRNLGDHYLTWDRHHDEFMDGDVLMCNHHLKSGDANTLEQARASYDEVFFNRDQFDPYGVSPEVTRITPNLKFKYSHILLQDRNIDGWGNPQWVITPYERETDRWTFIDYSQSKRKVYKELPTKDRLMPTPLLWSSSEPILGREIEGGFNWRVQTSTWDKSKDHIRRELYAAIDRETELVFIETAYSEFSTTFRDHVEAALKRGVPVKIITNSIYVSDAGSKAIRLIMARWTRQMLEKYPALFSIRFATIEHGHMIHFKGASFQCQRENDRVYRLNLVGSHNFHGRSGYSDKEHAVIWEQKARAACNEKSGAAGIASVESDLMNMREAFYAQLSKKASPIQPLKSYRTFEEELTDGIRSGKLSPSRERLSKLLLKMIYDIEIDAKTGEMTFNRDQHGRALLKTHDEFMRFMEIAAESGLADIFGALL